MESPFLFRPAKFGPVVGTDDIIPAPGGYEKVNEAFWREPCRLPRQVQKRLERAGKESCSVCVGKMVGSGVRVPVSPSGPGVASAVFWASLPTCHV